jgi:hypothetical protein
MLVIQRIKPARALVSLAMTQMTPPRRGRPKGTGIDDRPRLREIAALIARQPEIRPTTAIKLLGENDPSVIRRLRDKFHAMQAELMNDVRKAAADHLASRSSDPVTLSSYLLDRRSEPPAAVPPHATPMEPPVTTREATGPDAAAARIASLARHTRPDPAVLERFSTPPSPTIADGPTAEIARGPASANPYDAIIGLTIEASVAAIEQQMKIYEQIFRLPTVSLFVRNNIAVSQALMNIACSAMRASRSLSAAA